jgi:hypothetical protein
MYEQEPELAQSSDPVAEIEARYYELLDDDEKRNFDAAQEIQQRQSKQQRSVYVSV